MGLFRHIITAEAILLVHTTHIDADANISFIGSIEWESFPSQVCHSLTRLFSVSLLRTLRFDHRGASYQATKCPEMSCEFNLKKVTVIFFIVQDIMVFVLTITNGTPTKIGTSSRGRIFFKFGPNKTK